MATTSPSSWTYDSCLALLVSKGFSQLFMTSEGRHYFMKPEGELNEFGAPAEHATISVVNGKWHPTIFEFKGKRANNYRPALRIVGGTDYE